MKKNFKKSFPLILILIILTNPRLSYAANYFEQGKTYYVYKKFDKAKEMFLKAVEKYEHGDSYYFLGEIEKLEENYKKAMEYYLKASILKNTTGKYKKNAYWNLIVIAEMSGDYDYLIKTCIYLWEKLNDDGARKKIETIINKLLWTENKTAIDLYKAGISLKSENKNENANNKFRESINLQPDFLSPKFELGLYAYKNENYSEAVRYLNDIAAKIPFYAEVHLILAEINFKNKNYEKTIENYTKALEYGFNTPNTKYLIKIKRGTSYYNSGNYDYAKADVAEALEIKSNSLEALTLMSGINIKLNDYDAALKNLQAANIISRNNPFIVYQIGSIYYKKNDMKYLRHFDNLFDLISEDTGVINESYLKVFNIILKDHFEKKKFSRVIEIYTVIQKKYTDNNLDMMAAKSYFYINKYNKAIELFEKLSLNNDEKYILCSSYARTEKTDKAKELFKQIIHIDEYFKKGEKDPYLIKIVNIIENEKK